MSRKYRARIIFFLVCFVLPAIHVLAEGSKEIYITTHNTSLYLCNDFAGKCNTTPPFNGNRTQFAIYGCAEVDRMYFVKLHLSEVIYLGFNGSNAGNNNHIVFEIKNLAGTVVYPETTLPASGTGFIANIGQARVGPNQIYTTGGYTAIDFHPADTGMYYIEFTKKNTSNTVVTGNFNIDFFDVTLYDTVSHQVYPGRLYSKSWQFQEQSGCSAKTYVYSNDSIITSCTFNNLGGGVWVQYCNQTGCANTGNFPVDRKSLYNLQALLPEFRVFLNFPDVTLFPPATVLGAVVAPLPWGDRNCLTGHVLFHVNVNKPGKVTILLTFGGGYTPITLTITNAVVGENIFDWNGLDGAGLAVPNNTSITFTVSYINGLTNLPLYDVETNSNGFTISLESPTGAQVTSYWDDTNIPGGINNSVTGCATPPCHSWGNNWGNLNTVNTWWYNVSSSITQPPIFEFRNPGTLTFQQTPPQNYCENTSGHVFSVALDPNTDVYHWSYTPSTGVTLVPSGNSVTVSFGPGATSGTLSVYGTNTNCATQGPTSTLAITISAAPLPVIIGPGSVCVGSTGNSYATQTGMTGYFWTISPGGTINNGQGTSDAHVTWNTQGANTISVSYTNSNGCAAASPTSFPVTVHALPTPTITGLPSVCEGASSITYTTETGMSGYVWTVSSGATTTAGGTGFDFITLTWTTAGIHTLYVNYTDGFGCTALVPSQTTVTVNQLPNVTFTYNTPGSCSGVPLNIQLSSNVAGASFSWTATGSSGNVSPQFTAGTGDITIPFINSGTAIENVVFSVVPSAVGCSPGSPFLSNPVPIYPVPDLIVTPATLTVCSNAQASISLSSVVQNTTYSWTATGGTGITPATVNGVGNIAETFQNSGNTPATVSFAIVPSANGCSNNATVPYLLTVNPKPGVVFPPVPANPQTICSGTASASVNLQSTVSLPVITYAWTAAGFDPVNPTGSINGFTASNSGNTIPGETITSTLLGPGVVKYEVTATFTSGGATCPGDPSEYQVVVNPAPIVSLTPVNPVGQTICSGTSSTAITFSPNVTPVSYVWQAVEVVGINPPVMNGVSSSIPAQVLTVTGAVQGHVKYKVTPTFLGSGSNSCLGADSYSTIFVNPLPSPLITSTSPQTVCELQTNVLYSTPAIAGNSYSWTVTGSASVTNANTHAVTVNWGPYTASPGTVTVTETITATGCQVTTPAFPVTLQQRPVPTLTGTQTVCDGTSGVLYQTEPLMSNYTWSIAGGSITAGGGNASNTAVVTWNTPGAQWIQVNYVNGLGCPGFPAKQITVTVNPLPVSAISEGPGAVCDQQAHNYNTAADAASTFTWSVIPSASGAVTTGQGTNAITVGWLASGNATLALTVTKTSSGCSTSSTYAVLVHPTPAPAFSACFDVKTTLSAKKFTLKGGTPYLNGQGVYSGNRVSYNAGSGMYEFDPFGASTGNYNITYTYTNTFGCAASTPAVTITVFSNAFACNGDLTDVRDGKKYKTSLIGGKCWMRENLAYGTVLDPAIPQTDNCISEKYCLTTDPTCTTYGGLYQWDELLAYASTSAGQGLCPPEWHIPTEAEWQAMIDAIVAGVIPPVDGFGGSFLKDNFLNPGFRALTSGIYYLNNTWAFTSGTLTGTQYWSSTTATPTRGVARGVNLINPSISKYQGSRGNAFSVRCVKD